MFSRDQSLHRASFRRTSLSFFMIPTKKLYKDYRWTLKSLDKAYGVRLKPYQACNVIAKVMNTANKKSKEKCYTKQDMIDFAYLFKIAELRYFKWKHPYWEKPKSRAKRGSAGGTK